MVSWKDLCVLLKGASIGQLWLWMPVGTSFIIMLDVRRKEKGGFPYKLQTERTDMVKKRVGYNLKYQQYLFFLNSILMCLD